MAVDIQNVLAQNQFLWETMKVNPAKAHIVGVIGDRIKLNRVVYQTVATKFARKHVAKYPKCNVPWYFIGIVHYMECNLSLRHHLHNGDPLTARTKRVPKGRPTTGKPPFTFEDSAVDAMTLTGLHKYLTWTIPYMLYRLEGYNGYGYRTFHPEVNSPYLWSYTNHYTKGKYVDDGKFDENAVSQQCGAAPLLKYIIG